MRAGNPIIIVKKKGGHGGGHHGGAWKVAFADFITALMALFLVLWLVGQSQKVKQAIGGHFRNPPGILDGSRSGLLPGNEGVNEAIQPKEQDSPISFEDEMAKLERSAERLQQVFGETDAFKSIRNQIQIRMTPEGLEIQLTENAKKVLFQVGSAHPLQETKDVLVQIAKEIGKISNRAMIAGHTDRRPYSDERHYSNWELSSDRANGARRVLVENGMKPEQIARVVGFADTQLLNEKDPYADSNRRITILVLPLNEGRKLSALVSGPSEKKSSPVIPETQHEGDPKTPKKEAASTSKGSSH
jgi:chemotaxis protein MotB